MGPANIGSVARVMMNTGFDDLVLVDPVPHLCDEAYAMACNASAILLGARVFATIDDAVGDSALVIGATRRTGKVRDPHITLAEAVEEIARFAAAGRVSVLFGREDRGLSNEELARCDMLFHIPAHEANPSLNLSHAVFALCHALFTATGAAPGRTIRPAPRRETEAFYEHLERVLRRLGYGAKGGSHLPAAIMRNMRRLLGRTGLTLKEVRMLRGILTQIEKRTAEGDRLPE